MRLYSITVTATRTNENNLPEVSFQNLLGLMVDDMEIERDSLAHAHEVYPDSSGWTSHYATWLEIPQSLMFGPVRVTWQINAETENPAKGSE